MNSHSATEPKTIPSAFYDRQLSPNDAKLQPGPGLIRVGEQEAGRLVSCQ